VEDLLKTTNLTKSYPGVIALSNLNFDVKHGEIHAVCGENGAGKSTLMKILSGAVEPDAGEIVFEGKYIKSNSPQYSRSIGISVIYQEFTLVPSLSVAENIYLGRSLGNKYWFNPKKLINNAKSVLNNIGIDINPEIEVKHLSVAFQQMVEIAKAVSSNVKLLIMDEPTATLTNNEISQLFKLIRILQGQGVSIIYVSHRLDEVFHLSDRITVLRDGTHISTLNTKDTDQKELIRLMVGRTLDNVYVKNIHASSEKILEVSGLTNNKVKDINFFVNRGEIVGFSGLVGSGRTEMARSLFGADKLISGKIQLGDQYLEINSPTDAIQQGIGLIPEDRKAQGLHINHDVGFNVTLPSLKSRFSIGIFVKRKSEKKVVNEFISKLKIKTPSDQQIAKNLSGGNQQKVVISKWLAAQTDVIIFDEPTRGVDVGAKREIYELISMLAAEGKGIIVISSDMPEIIGITNRIYVMYEGKISGCLHGEEVTQENILTLASGQKIVRGDTK
jgi:ribose transport system ATP-binding protein